MKQCKQCGEIKELVKGRRICRKCKNKNGKKWVEENKEYIKQYRKIRYNKNKEKINKRNKEYGVSYRVKNKNKIKERKHIFYLNNKEKINKRNKEYNKKYGHNYYINNAEKIKEKARLHYHKNKNEYNRRNKIYVIKNKQKISDYYRQYRIKNRDREIAVDKLYRLNNAEKIKERSRLSRIKHKEENDKIRKIKYKEDTNYKIKLLLRQRTRGLIRNGNIDNKYDHTLNMIGCSLDYLKQHLQQTSIQNGYLDFNINNYSGYQYHIDHIIPCSKFNLKCSYHQKLCFNWSNMQILSAKENMSKFNKIKMEET
jgi:hypothetical protein